MLLFFLPPSICTGSIIAQKYVLTSGDCLNSLKKDNFDKLFVYVGTRHRYGREKFGNEEDRYEKIEVKSIVFFDENFKKDPKLITNNLKNDIAILEVFFMSGIDRKIESALKSSLI